MKKLRLYLDTSVISHLDAPDAPEKEADTQRLWEDITSGRYEVVLSDVVFDEIVRCEEPKQSFMLSKIAEINPRDVRQDDESERLSTLYFEVGGLPPKSKDDAMHIAIATVNNCDVILSWNFKHIVNLRAMKAVEAVNLREGYNPIRILSPTMILDEEE
ncbi:MAG: PIN domain-containing protein [Synergistaceae bacterium]|jgi:predicted nucleic acid-binding protein|nr:PIN domain-containing protein [Synergistaceae bacterium]